MFPESHCLYVVPSLRVPPLIFQACARFFLATAVWMNWAATRRAPRVTFVVGGSGFGSDAGLLLTLVLMLFAVFPHLTATNAITPTSSSRTATRGSHLFAVRDVKRS